MDQPHWPKVVDVFPELAAELKRALVAEERQDLAETVDHLELRAPCGCGECSCASFYTDSPDLLKVNELHKDGVAVDSPVVDCIDTLNGKIAYVEILNNPELKAALDLHFSKRNA